MNHYTFRSYAHIYEIGRKTSISKWIYIILLAIAVFLFLPWTQNIRARGMVTTLYQDQRPQEINTIIAGKVVKWHVKEGDFVKEGDTLIQLTEVKLDYLDPALLERTKEQLQEKNSSVGYYENKVGTAKGQINALNASLALKLEQLSNKIRQLQLKIQGDSAEAMAAGNDLRIAKLQYDRQRSLYDSGLVSLSQLESRNLVLQQASAKKISADNKYANSRQDLTIAQIEINALKQENMEKVAKAEGDQFQSLSQIATGRADIAKLQNLYASYTIRNGMYTLLAPQSGQVVKAQKAGIGEIVKEGEMIAEIVPDKAELAVEIYVRPVDLPLVEKGQKVRFLFDGFPAIVFSGWPKASSGTFGGEISAVETSVSINGKFRVLIKQDPTDRRWPAELKVGTGANGITLLKDVPIWYELWRNINGFPPDHYKKEDKKKQKS